MFTLMTVHAEVKLDETVSSCRGHRAQISSLWLIQRLMPGTFLRCCNEPHALMMPQVWLVPLTYVCSLWAGLISHSQTVR